MVDKKLTNSKDDNFDDFDFDFGDFDSAPPPPPTGREAIKAAASGTLKGIKQRLISPATIERAVRDSLPEGYGQAKDLFDNTKYTVQNTWREAVDTLKPLESQLKSLNEKIIPKIEGIAPEKFLEKLRKFTNERVEREKSDKELRDESNEQLLGEIFKQQEIAEEGREKRGEKRMELEQGLAQLRHKDISSFLGQISESTTRLAQYQDNVLVKYQRQALRISLQHYGVAADTLAVLKQSHSETQEKLTSLVHNSSLPDFRKMQLDEAAAQHARDAMIEGARKAVFGSTADYVNRLTENVGKKIKSSLTNFTSAVGTGLSFGGMALDDDPFGPREDAVTGAGRTVGNFLAGKGMGYASKAAKAVLGKDRKKARSINATGSELAYRVMNSGSLVHDFLTKESDGSMFGDARKFFADTFAPSMVNGFKVDTDNIDSLTKAAGFTGLDGKAIREVIPGYLSAILQQVTMLRTGGDAPRMTYDYSTGSFKTDRQVKDKIVNDLFGSSRQGARDSAEQIIKSIDRGGRLSDDEREQAIKALISNTIDGKGSDISNLAKSETWGTGDGANNIADVFKRFIRTDKDGKRLLSEGNLRRQIYVSSGVNQMAQGIGNPVEQVQQLVKAGYKSQLVELGVIDEYGAINRGKLKEVISMNDGDYLENYNQVRAIGKSDETKGFASVVELAKKHKLDDKAGGMLKGLKEKFKKPEIDTTLLSAAESLKVAKEQTLSFLGSAKDTVMDQVSRDKIDSIKKAITAAKDTKEVNYLSDMLDKVLDRAGKASTSLRGASIDAVAQAGNFISDKAPEVGSGITDFVQESKELAQGNVDVSEEIRDTQAQARAPTDKIGGFLDKAKGKATDIVQAMREVVDENARNMRELFGVKPGEQIHRQAAQGSLANTGSDTRMIYDVLLRIEEILKGTAATTMSLTETMATTNNVQMQALLDPPERQITVSKEQKDGGVFMNVKTALAGKSYTSLMEHAMDTAKSTVKKVGGSIKDFASKHKAKLFSGLGFVRDIGNRIKGTALYGAARAINSMSSVVGDVYVGAELTPRLTVGGLRSGAYFDKNTKKVLASLGGITGDVVDADGNVVLADSDIDRAYIGGTVRQALRDVTKKGLRTIKSIGDLASRFIPRAVNDVISLAKGAVDKVKSLLPPYDVYVDGQMDEPVLFANKFRLGIYYSKKTGAALRHPRDVDGPVLGSDGNYVVSTEQYEAGLVDVNGAPIGSAVARMFGKVGAGLHRGLGFLKSLGRGAMNLAGTVLGGLKDYFREIFTPFSEVISNSKKSLDVLTKIFNLLDERLPGGKKVLGDMNGDGIRDGSIEDIRRKKAEKDAAKAAAAADPSNPNYNFKNSIFGKMAGMFMGAGAMFGGKKKKDDDDDDDDSGWGLSDAADAAILAGEGIDGIKGARDALRARKAAKALKAAKAAGGAVKAGRMARFGKFLGLGRAGKILGGIGRGVMGAAKLGGTALATVAPGLVSFGGKAAGMIGRHGLATLGRAGTILGGGARMGALAARGGAGLLGGAARLAGKVGLKTIASRAALATGAGLAAGAVGGGAMGTVGAIAAAALGWPATIASVGAWALWKGYKYLKSTKLEQMSRLRIIQYGFDPREEDVVKNILAFEDMIAPKVKVSEDGKIEFNPKDIDMDDVCKLFGVDPKSGVPRFNEWYHTRFRPVLAANLTNLAALNKESGKDIKLTNAAKLTAPEKLKLVTKATVNMDNAHNYMRGPSDSMPVTMSDTHVKDEVKRLMVEFDKEQKDKGKPELSASSAIATSAAVVGGNIDAKEALERFSKNQSLYKVVGKDGKEITGSDQEKMEALSKGAATLQAAMGIPADLVYNDKGRVDALSAVRFKTYGLKTMESDKVKTLRALERLCEKHLTFDGKTARVALSNDQVMHLAGTNFGQVDLTGKAASEWRYWFNLRFLPAYLKYVSTGCALAKTTSMDVVRTSLTPQDQVEVAQHVVNTMTNSSSGGRCRVWDVANEAWVGYELATNPDITITNIEALRELAKKVILGEVNTQATTDEKGNIRQTDFKEAVDTGGKGDGIRQSKMNNLLNQYSSNSDGKGLMASGDTIVGEGQVVRTSGDKALAGTSSPVEFTKLPASGGDGWAANKELILAAAKAAGVNPKLLASMIGMESSFKPNSLNKTTQAAGLGNFLPKTWQYVTAKYGAKYGITPQTSVFDARANALMTAEYIRENNAIIKSKLGRDMNSLDAYMAHFLGGEGLSSFLGAGGQAIGAEVSPAAARSNPNIFFTNPKTQTGARKVSEIVELFKRKMDGILPSYAIAANEFTDMEQFKSTESETVVTASTGSQGGAIFAPAVGSPTPYGGASSSMRQLGGQRVGYTGPAGGGTGAGAPRLAAQQPGYGAPGLQDATGRSFAPPLYNNAYDNKLNEAQLSSMPKGTLKVTLQREESKTHGTFGIMSFEDGTKFHTMELAWLENKPRESCIPAGQYVAKRRPSPKFGMPYEVMNVQGRSAILIHAGSFGGSKAAGMRADSAGCILLGLRRDEKAAQPRICDTKAAMAMFDRITGNATILLTILPSKGQMNASVQAAVDTASGPTVSGDTGAAAPVADTSAPAGGYAASASGSASSEISSVASGTSFAPSAPTPMPETPAGGYASSASNIASRAAARVGNAQNNYAPSVEEIRANNRNNVNTEVLDGLKSVNELLSKILTVQETSATHLGEIAKNTKETVEQGTALAKSSEDAAKASAANQPPAVNRTTPSRELKKNPVPMGRMT